MAAFYQGVGWVTDEDEQWTTEGDGFFDIEFDFASQADIRFSDNFPEIINPQNFTSTANIVSDITDPVFEREWSFSSTAAINTDLSSDISAEREFASAPTITHDISSDISGEREFASAATITHDISSAIINPQLFASTAAIQSDITSDVGTIKAFQVGPMVEWDDSIPNMNVEREFYSYAGAPVSGQDEDVFPPAVDWSVVAPKINNDKLFTSTADIVTGITDPVIVNPQNFSSAPVVGWVTNAPDMDLQIEFSSAPIIGWTITSDILRSRNFLVQSFITTDITDPLVQVERQFASTAGITWDTENPAGPEIDQGGMFKSTAGIPFNIRSDIKRIVDFDSTANIVTVISDPAILKLVNFQTTANIVWDATSGSGTARLFSSEPTVTFDISSDIKRRLDFTSSPTVTFDLTSDMMQEMSFESQADIVWDATADIVQERQFASTANISWDIQSDANAERSFASTGDVVFDLSSDVRDLRKFTSTGATTFDIQSAGGNARREFSSVPTLVWDATADIVQEMSFESQSDIVFDIQSDHRQERHFATQADVVWDLNNALLRRFLAFNVAPNVTFAIDPQDIFKINKFKTRPVIDFITLSTIFMTRQFTSESDIIWNVSESEIHTNRNFASTVNILIKIESLNILNMSFDDLFPTKFRSLTPKQTATLVGK